MSINVEERSLFHDNEILHDVEAISIRLQGQLFSSVCADSQVPVLIDTSHRHLLVATATQLNHCVTGENDNSLFRQCPIWLVPIRAMILKNNHGIYSGQQTMSPQYFRDQGVLVKRYLLYKLYNYSIPVQPVVVVLSLDSSHPSVFIETQVPLQPVECEGQQCLYCERWEGSAPYSSVM